MRVVNVKDIKSRQEQRAKRYKKSQLTKKLTIVTISTLIIGAAAYGLWYLNTDAASSTNMTHNSDNNENYELLGLPDVSGEMKSLKGNDFRDLYRAINYPNVTTFTEAPEITGNIEADDRIRQLASSRGFVLTGYPTSGITATDDELVAGTEDNLLQPYALKSWKLLEKEATTANIPLKLNSGYRSVERQRELFTERLLATGVTFEQIAAGLGDEAVESTLYMTAPPGYSRHHTGYTIDLVCGDGLTAFQDSPCDIWLQSNDFAVAKKHGWIPSYPDDADSQGPEPEPWEYVWVGTRHLQE